MLWDIEILATRWASGVTEGILLNNWICSLRQNRRKAKAVEIASHAGFLICFSRSKVFQLHLSIFGRIGICPELDFHILFFYCKKIRRFFSPQVENNNTALLVLKLFSTSAQGSLFVSGELSTIAIFLELGNITISQ